jgi:LPXTG-site transpeptidase (sortase) family protein
MTARWGRRGAAVASVLLMLIAALVGCTGGTTSGTGTSGGVVQSPVSRHGHWPLTRSTPAIVDIPKIGARSSLIGLGLNDDETVQVPPIDQPMQAGWYALGPSPGETGPAVLLGHVDGDSQPGIFKRLNELQVGDEVTVYRADGTTAIFTVSRTQQVAKSAFPTEAVYGETKQPELRLITCGGFFDAARRSYRDNIIVYAVIKAVRDGVAVVGGRELT